MPYAVGNFPDRIAAIEALTLDRTGLVVAVEQPPEGNETFTVDGVFIKPMIISKRGTLIPQHSHKHRHASYVARGAVRVWRDGVLGEIVAFPGCIEIAAGVKHTFQSLEDDTVVLCIHNLHGAAEVAIEAENQLVTAPCDECKGCEIG